MNLLGSRSSSLGLLEVEFGAPGAVPEKDSEKCIQVRIKKRKSQSVKLFLSLSKRRYKN